MQLAEVLCYVFLTITITASCSRAEKQTNEVEDTQDGKRISKREATLIVDFNENPMDRILLQKPKVIYRRRISKARYAPPKSKYGSLKPKYGPPRSKNRPPKASRKPGKARRNGKPRTTSPKYGPPEPKYTPHPNTNKKRTSKNKAKYGYPTFRPAENLVKVPHYSYFIPDKSSFGEPPAQEMDDYTPYQQSYGEPPVDSYGAPLKFSINDVYPTAHSFQESAPHDNIHEYTKHDHQWNNKYTGSDDTNFAYTKTEPKYSNFVTPTPKDSHLDSLDSVRNKQILQDNTKVFRKKRPFGDFVKKPWKSNNHEEFDDEIIVGGQYAEPPARAVPKTRQHTRIYDVNDEEDSFPDLLGYADIVNAPSANNSPYSNYKHSNMAFSPQNLNDAFSIVNK